MYLFCVFRVSWVGSLRVRLCWSRLGFSLYIWRFYKKGKFGYRRSWGEGRVNMKMVCVGLGEFGYRFFSRI